MRQKKEQMRWDFNILIAKLPLKLKNKVKRLTNRNLSLNYGEGICVLK